MKDSNFLWKIINLCALTMTVAVNALADIIPIGGLTTKEVSDLYPTFVTPTGITFAIWGLIYALLGFVLVSEAFMRNSETTSRMSFWFLATCLLNIVWIFTWHFKLIATSFVVILALWLCLLFLTQRTENSRKSARIAFEIYFAWVTAATVVSLNIMLANILPGLHLRNNAIFMMIISLTGLFAYAIVRLIVNRDIVFSAVTAWVLWGVFVSHYKTGYNGMYPFAVVFSLVSAILMTLVFVHVTAAKMRGCTCCSRTPKCFRD